MKKGGGLVEVPVWSEDQLESDRLRSIEGFRVERTTEPLERYLSEYEACEDTVATLLKTTGDLAHLRERAVDALSDKQRLEAVRYLASPPISEDDLKTIASVGSVAPGVLAEHPETATHLVDTILLALDEKRFPWVGEERKPTTAERRLAIVASAVLVATRRVETARRNEGKEKQELRVCEVLLASGYKQVDAHEARSIAEAPALGEFCRESLLGTRKADLLVRLWDQRIMPIECKVSNSATNSIKRLNNDAAVKAEVWRKDFGELNVVPAAVLAGVFKIRNLVEAQHRGLALFWAHDLDTMSAWIGSTRP